MILGLNQETVIWALIIQTLWQGIRINILRNDVDALIKGLNK